MNKPFSRLRIVFPTLLAAALAACGGGGSTVANTGGGGGTGTAGTLALSAATASVSQPATSVTLGVSRTGGSSGAVSVAYATANGTASAGTHYTATSGTLNWADGDAAAKSISVPISAAAFAGSKTFTVTISAAGGGATLGVPATATATITGSSVALAGTLALSSASYSATQPATTVTLSVARSGGSSGAVSVAYATSNGTATAGSEYTAASGTLNWADGDTASKSIGVTLSTTAFSGTKTFTVSLSAPGGSATLGTPASATVSIVGSAAGAADVVVTVNPALTHAISPYIYGLNDATTTSGVSAIPFDRAGGNRWTAYNWENNASNAGSDFNYQSDSHLSSSSTPAEGVRTVIAADQAAGMASLITIQMQGLVAADKNGPVSIANPPDMTRFKTVVPQKSSVSATAFTTAPPTTDANVYMDEFVWALDQKFPGQSIFGNSPVTRPAFISLDNEPELWNSTHLEIQGSTMVTSDAYIAKTLALTRAVKAQFPNAVIFGPAHYGFGGIINWQGEMASATPSGANWFTDKYLAALKAASTTFGHPLVDVYDFHWYSEATDASGTRVINLTGTTLSADQVQAIVQSPRSLWDPTFSERSWVAQFMGSPIRMLPRLQAKIDAGFPGMRLAITEYNNGGAHHIAGTIAQADNLGIFGAQNVFAANYWALGTEPFIVAAFNAFRNFDSLGANFGDISLQASSNNIANVAVYASKDSTRATRTVFVAINRAATAQVTQVSGATLTGTAHLFQITAASAQGQATIKPVAAGTQAVSGTSMTVTLPALSVTTIDVY